MRWKFIGSACSGHICCWRGKFDEARAYYENALSLWDPTYRAFASTLDPYVVILTFLSRTLLCLGYVDQARLRQDEALAEARRRSPFNLVFVQGIFTGVRATEGLQSAQMMLRSAEEMVAISSEQGFPLWLGTGNIMRGWCLGAMGQAAEGIALLLQGIATWRPTSNLGYPFILTTLAEVYGIAGQPEEGLNRLAEAAEWVETIQDRWAEAEIQRLRGTLLRSMHEYSAAEDSYRRALAVARQQSAKFWELRAALDLARLWRDQGRRTEARDLLAPIYRWFTEGFDTPVLQEARSLLEQLN